MLYNRRARLRLALYSSIITRVQTVPRQRCGSRLRARRLRPTGFPRSASRRRDTYLSGSASKRCFNLPPQSPISWQRLRSFSDLAPRLVRLPPRCSADDYLWIRRSRARSCFSLSLSLTIRILRCHVHLPGRRPLFARLMACSKGSPQGQERLHRTTCIASHPTVRSSRRKNMNPPSAARRWCRRRRRVALPTLARLGASSASVSTVPFTFCTHSELTHARLRQWPSVSWVSPSAQRPPADSS